LFDLTQEGFTAFVARLLWVFLPHRQTSCYLEICLSGKASGLFWRHAGDWFSVSADRSGSGLGSVYMTGYHGGAVITSHLLTKLTGWELPNQ
jgi:hypothetical protein